MKFNRDNEIKLWYSLVDIFGSRNLIVKSIPNVYFAFAIRKDEEDYIVWELHEIIGKGGKVVKCKGSHSGYKIEIGGK